MVEVLRSGGQYLYLTRQGLVEARHGSERYQRHSLQHEVVEGGYNQTVIHSREN